MRFVGKVRFEGTGNNDAGPRNQPFDLRGKSANDKIGFRQD